MQLSKKLSDKKLSKTQLLLLVGLFLNSFSSFMIIPIFTIYLNKSLGLTISTISIIANIKIWFQYGMMPFSGLFSDKIGFKLPIIFGFILRGFSYLILVLTKDPALIGVSSAIMGFSSSLYSVAAKSYLAVATNEKQRNIVFSLRSFSNNVGAAVGPAFSSILLFIGIKELHLFIFVFFCYLLITLLFIRIPEVKIKQPPSEFRKGEFLSIVKELNVVVLFYFSILFGLLYSQFQTSLPLFLESNFSKSHSGLAFTLNSLIVIGLQIPLMAFLTKHFKAKTMFGLVFLVFVIAFLSLNLVSSLGFFAICLFIFFLTIAEIIFDPTIDSEVSQSVLENKLGIAFGIMGLANAIGQTIGNYLFGRFYNQISDIFFWSLFGIIGVLGMIFVLALQTQKTHREVYKC